MQRTSRLKQYHRLLNRSAAARANHKLRDYFDQPRGWEPMVADWQRGITLRLRGEASSFLAERKDDPAVAEMAVEAVVDEIMDDPKPFVQTLLEDLISEDSWYGRRR